MLTKNQWKTIANWSWGIALCSMFMLLTGCAGLPVWVTDGESILPIASGVLATVLAIVAEFNGKTIPPVVVSDINAAVNTATESFETLETLVKEYQANPGTSVLTDIQTTAGLIVTNLSNILDDARITDVATRQKITAIAQLVINELQAWVSILPMMGAKAGTRLSVQVPLTAKEFKEAFNTILDTKTGDVETDLVLSKAKRA